MEGLVEVGEVGREGFSGVQAAVGINKNQAREIVQIAGNGFRVKISALKSVLQSAPGLERILTRYAVVPDPFSGFDYPRFCHLLNDA